MKVATGRVVEGKIVLEGEPLAEGAVVAVVARDDDDTFDVPPDEDARFSTRSLRPIEGRSSPGRSCGSSCVEFREHAAAH